MKTIRESNWFEQFSENDALKTSSINISNIQELEFNTILVKMSFLL